MTEEYQRQFNMSYKELSAYLQEKYGKPKGNYFLNESCKSPNKNIKRVSDGLYIHHIAEYHDDYEQIDNLSQKEKAVRFPYEFQTPNWLCYCNFLEHAILHYKIYELRMNKLPRLTMLDDGLVHYILPELKEWYKTKGSIIRGTWKESAYNIIKDNEKDFSELYVSFYKRFPMAPKYSYQEYYNIQTGGKLQRVK